METKKIMILLKFEPRDRARLAEAAPGCEFIYGYDKNALTEVSAIIGNPPPEGLSELEKLKWLQLMSAGAESYTRPGVLPPGCALTNTTGAFGLAISEHMVACVLTLYKKLHLYRDNQLRCEWLDRGEVKRVEGAVTLVVGLGDIGGSFARRMKALGAYIIGVRRTEGEKPDYADEVYTSDSLDTLLPGADIVALALPGTALTKKIISRERIAIMKRGATLLNVGRGSAVDTMALCEALRSGRLYGAALDVTDPEPLPPDHPLWKCENALITPHVSGFFHLRDTYERIADICITNAGRFCAGLPLKNHVDFETGYLKTTSK